MTDCKVFSSLFALVDSHLSNLSLEESQSGDNVKNSVPTPCIGSASEVYLSTIDQKLPTPKLSVSGSPIAKVLATQVNNMLLAKERKRQEELKQQEAEEKLKKEEDDFVKDLMQAMLTPNNVKTQLAPKSISSSSSCESLFYNNFIDWDEETKEDEKSAKQLLPCAMDMSYILNKQIPKTKCSSFGKVLISRQKPVAGKYWHEKFETSVKAFKFDTPSPCDVIKANLRKPTVSCSATIEDFLYI